MTDAEFAPLLTASDSPLKAHSPLCDQKSSWGDNLALAVQKFLILYSPLSTFLVLSLLFQPLFSLRCLLLQLTAGPERLG